MAKRQGKRTPEIEDAILSAIAEGIPLREICRREDMPSWRAVYDWLEADEDFASRFARARELGYEALAEETLDIADDGTNDWVERRMKDGSTAIVLNGEHVQRSRLRIDTRLKLLAKWSPTKYGDKQTHEIANKDGESFKTEGNSPDVAKLAATLAASLRMSKREADDAAEVL